MTVESGYPINANGQTYGSTAHLSAETHPGPMDHEALLGQEPDLVLSTDIDGTIGYVRNTGLRPPPPRTPGEAILITASEPAREIPLFESDGTTVIGSFRLS